MLILGNATGSVTTKTEEQFQVIHLDSINKDLKLCTKNDAMKGIIDGSDLCTMINGTIIKVNLMIDDGQ